MNEIQTNLSVQDTIISYLSAIQQENNIPSIVMENAINKYLALLKEQMLREIIIDKSQNKKEEEDGINV